MNDIIYLKIGRGSYGKVRLVEHDGTKLARKEIKIRSESEKAEVVKEINLLNELKDRNILIIKDYKICDLENKCYIYTEYLENGDLMSVIKNKEEKKEDFSIEV